MNVKELAQWLLEFHDQDAIVEVVVHHDGSGYYDQGGNAEVDYFDPNIHTTYTDLRGNQFINPYMID